ncbi:DNA mismatch repair protein Msh6 [Fasciolopsis buskii]|uniref:DNA mismatch repair protein Msh6 n=1 Tax=Fasciolopsis buskii TaxID=27845 RepID=A0A8E0VFV7_9TREM|nr:DNA mismatch repair protein Msh6 [Fasciolopsis buski]
MQPTLLRFFSRNSNGCQKPIVSSTGGKEKLEDAKKTIDDVNECCKTTSGDGDTRTRPRRRVIYESSDEENVCDTDSSQISLNNSVQSCSRESTDLSVFACSSPTVNRINSASACGSSYEKFKSRENLENSLMQSSLMGDESDEIIWEHLTLPFLKPEKVMDASNRRPNAKDYDPSTLFVPKDFLAKQSPGMRQWWELKARYADVLLLFKVGKFYELYHMDASVAVNELGLVYMRGSYAHCGFPEVAFPRMAYALVKKVGRVEQTESVDAMNERTRGRPASEKVVRREVCQLLTPGTCTATDRAEVSHVDHMSQGDEDLSQMREVVDDSSSYLIAVSERRSQVNEECEFGIALLNAVTGKIMVDFRKAGLIRCILAWSVHRRRASFSPPDAFRSLPSQSVLINERLLSSTNSTKIESSSLELLVLVERGAVGPSLKSLLNTSLSGVPIEQLFHGKQFWTAKDTISEIETADYFHRNKEECSGPFAVKQNWPISLLKMLSEDDPLGRSVKPNFDLAVSSFGAVIYYLRYCLIDREVLSLGYLETYVPPDVEQHRDGQSIRTDEPFYFRQPVMASYCFPFCFFRNSSKTVIRLRQDAIDNLIEMSDRLGTFREGLRRLPDFERLLTKIHLLGSKGSDKDHPDSRAILFEEVQYSRKNIMDFVATLNGFELVYKMLDEFRHLPVRSEHLKSLTSLSDDGGTFPSLQSKISYFKVCCSSRFICLWVHKF